MPRPTPADGPLPYDDEFRRCLGTADAYAEARLGTFFTARWRPGWAEHLVRIGVLREAELAEWWYCDCCDGVTAQVQRFYEDERGVRMAKVWCLGENFHADEVEAERLRQWAVSLEGVARLVAAGIDRRLGCRTLRPDRLALLGTTGALGPPTTLFLACGLHWDDGLALAQGCEEIRRAESPMLLTIGAPPPLWHEGLPPVVRLDELATLRGDAIEMDLEALSAAAWRLRPDWLSQQQAVDLLAKDLGRSDRKRLTAMVSTAGGRREFRTNGEAGVGKLIDAVSFAAWRLRKRDEALDRAERI